jgi:hypothetical protein
MGWNYQCKNCTLPPFLPFRVCRQLHSQIHLLDTLKSESRYLSIIGHRVFEPWRSALYSQFSSLVRSISVSGVSFAWLRLNSSTCLFSVSNLCPIASSSAIRSAVSPLKALNCSCQFMIRVWSLSRSESELWLAVRSPCSAARLYLRHVIETLRAL